MKKKLKLHDLEVSSFITDKGRENIATLKGGSLLTGMYPTLPVEDCAQIQINPSLIPTDCCTGYYPSINAPCETITG